MTDKEKYETLKRLKARLECDELQVKGIAEICNPPYMCEECNLNYAQGTLGQRNNDLAIAISSLQNSIPIEWIMWKWRRDQPDDTQEEAWMRLGVLKMLRDWRAENEESN